MRLLPRLREWCIGLSQNTYFHVIYVLLGSCILLAPTIRRKADFVYKDVDPHVVASQTGLSPVGTGSDPSWVDDDVGTGSDPSWVDDDGGGNVGVASQDVHPHVPFVDGANCLFIGHSFFIPESEDFDQLAQVNGFSKHGYSQIFAPGENGAPLALWNDEGNREQVAGILATGRVDLLGMTTFSEANSTVAAYRNWIDLAREYNKETAFFIGMPWMPNAAETKGTAYDAQLEAAYDDQVEERTAVVVELRRLYPENQVFVVAYRKVVSVMKERFEAGTLPDIAALVGKKSKSLFKDKFGHVGLMAQELSALTWMHTLYGADVGDLTLLRGWDEDSVADITSRALEFNEQFLA